MRSETLHGWFAQQAAETPAAPALTADGVTLSSRELDTLANDVAGRLAHEGVGRGDLVPVCVAPGRAVPAILGVLKSGAAYVPLDPSYPDARLADCAERVAARVVVADGAVARRVRGWYGEPPTIVTLASSARDTRVDVDVAPDAPAYVMFTSGSTGTPKGVQVSHRNVVSLMRATQSVFELGADDVWTMFHSYAFDFSVWEMWGALLYGGRLVVVGDEEVRAPDELLALLERERVTVLSQTPSALLNLVQVEEHRPTPLERLRLVVLGGERLDPPSLAGWFARRGDERPQVVNMYGITETTVHVTYRRITKADGAVSGRSPIGRPLPAMAISLRDEQGRPTPAGGVGEICVSGTGVASGYLDDPGATADAFRDVDWGPNDRRRTYFSGDLARDVGGGELEYVGRRDNQVKVRGYRIELGEVAAAIKAHPDAVDAYASTDTGTSVGLRLVGWVVWRPGRDGERDLRAFLARRLPPFMIPGELRALERLPLTPNGKVDRRALLDEVREQARRPVRGEDADTTDESLEDVVAGIWAEVLDVPHVRAEDDFFALGGDSLLVLKVVSQTREWAGVDLRVTELFTAPRLGEFVRRVRAAQGR
jgi:amino acid adenylation domain-containing protein